MRLAGLATSSKANKRQALDRVQACLSEGWFGHFRRKPDFTR